MAFRFRRTLKVAPGLRMNLSRSGLSASLGPRGLTASIGRQGLQGNVGLPGTGLSYRSKLTGSPQQPQAPQLPNAATDSVRIVLQDSGAVEMQTPDGARLPPRLERMVREQHGDALRAWLEDQCHLINEATEGRIGIHLKTPSPEDNQQFRPAIFSVPFPDKPQPKQAGMLGALFQRRREQIESENQQALEMYEREREEWEKKRVEFDTSEARRRLVFEELRYSDQDVMHDYLTEVLQALSWPAETTVSFELTRNGTMAFIDVDLPEIEDFPRRTARIAARGLNLIFKEASESQHRRNYSNHVHGIGFRVTGIAFASLPKLETVVISAYSQRPDKATGHVNDDYLYSVKIPKTQWSCIDFTGLERLDVADALGAFEIRRAMSKTGIFQPIKPFAPDDNSTESE